MTDPALSTAVTIIGEFEGFRSDPYQDQVGIWTIAYGNTHLPDGSRVTQSTPPVSQDTALLWLRTGVSKTLAAVRAMVCVPISDNAAASLTSFAWNLGTARLRDSSIMTLLNQNEPAAAADYFMSYIYAGGKPNDGLRNRRMKEMALFLTGVGTHQNPAIPAAGQAKTALEEITPPEPTTDDLNTRSLAGTFTPTPTE